MHRAGDKDAKLKAGIAAIYERHKGRYGYRRITDELRNAGSQINHKAVQRVMNLLGLKSLVRPKKYRAYRGQFNVEVANILDRRFHADRPHEKWVTDVTEFNVRGDKLYLSPVMDLYNGEIVAYETRRRPEFPLVSNMLKKALSKLDAQQAPLMHSDQGWQGVFNRSSQHLNLGGVYGTTRGVDAEVDWARSDALAGCAVAPA